MMVVGKSGEDQFNWSWNGGVERNKITKAKTSTDIELKHALILS